jgi:hypothetical protein
MLWDNLIEWLSRWKTELPDFPEINLDLAPDESFNEIKELEPRYWRKLLENDQLWDDGIVQVLFSNGSTLRLLIEYFSDQPTSVYRNLATLLKRKLFEYYR